MNTLAVSQLAETKQLPEDFLRGLGLRETQQRVSIPYRDEAGNLLFERLRLSLNGPRRFLQPAGVSPAPCGLDRL